MKEKIAQMLNEIHAKKPLVHHITNYVTVNDCANIALAIGASPVMADDIEEVCDIVSISSALVLNIGTLNGRTIQSSIVAGKKANESGKPVIFDPVGAGASALRNTTAAQIISNVKCGVVRGNMSEIKFIAGENSNTKGVDASECDFSEGISEGIKIAETLAKRLNCVIAITGETDIISDGVKTLLIMNGHKMLGSVTGTGCMCDSLIGAYCGVTNDYLLAAAAGIMSMGIAGELAYEESVLYGLGSFHTSIIDSVSKLTPEILMQRARIDEA